MNARLLIPLLAALTLTACAGDDEASPPTPSISLSPTPAPAKPTGMTAGDYWFRGVVTEMNTSCYFDAICSVTVEVTESLGDASLEEGTEVVVIESYGLSPHRCEGEWSETPPGREVEVLAHKADGDSLAVCDGEHYFVKDAQATE